MKEKILAEKGFTAVELILAASLSLIIAYGIFTAISTGNDQIRTADIRMSIQESAREGVYKMVQEIRLSAPDRIAVGGGGVSIQFSIPDPNNPVAANYSVNWAGSHRIQYALGGLNNRQILRTNLTTGQVTVIANDVTNLNFTGNGGAPTAVTVLVATQRAMINGRLIPAQPLQVSGQAEIRNPRT